MPTDQSNTVSPDGARNATGNQVLAGHTPAATNAANAIKTAAKKTKLRPKRRLKESDVNVVDKPMLRKALGGTIVGNTMEWYDVGVFGYLITTMGPVFLPEADKSVQTLFLLGTFAATFIARPLGGVVFGWLGDKVGRQKVLAATLMLMAASTFAVGLLPGYAQIGIWAAALLVILKLIQGFSTGGEYAGATTFVSEYAPDKRRGYFASFLDMGSYIGFALGAALVSVLQLTLGQAAMEEWGWRIPFLIAGPLGLIAVYFRSKIEESPQFQATLDAQEASAKDAASQDAAVAKGPIGIVKAYWRQIVLAMILAAAANTVGYALTSYMPTYLTDSKGYDPVHGTLLTIPVLVIMAVCIPLTGKLSDRIGRRPVLWVGAGSTIVFSVPAFLLIGIGEIWSTLAGLALIAFPVTFYIANLASALPALFPTSSRYGGMGIAYNFSVAIFGGTTPFIVQGLIEGTGDDMMPAYYLMATSIVGAIAIYFLRESAQRPLPGSMPSVDTQAEARELVATQDTNPLINLDEMPFDGQPIDDAVFGKGKSDLTPA
ncbi:MULTISPECIES: MFS transporter [Paenarthrobacter]|jgi:MHS family proline/betaine transporter-like MFS transporter|uniref:MHS family proline/betaine transporter-like MFS transporter n=1 Tax=Paenarthrobacter nicotinovorans TaxID=29320 RepID=A0ABT9TTI8_PAENI|nr:MULTISPECIES: MFS transporter [Paenarthrobacter]KIA74945.1 proline-betaine transporter [Arthrobacter sp. MWB30]KQQ98289.1 MFS transporter [Arthrobacter sp. Leaf145]SKB95002.1 MFS transporter, MHS family, proline/betaine transporter [Arthrobacter sp. 31Cvi3.1E]BCW38744.1 MFS transporter [Arthrobacter sp. StoSoilB3]MBP2394291.1 MHS family proline/betaine transporter-like MFS transporter [Paenarthrobacter nicotinovorans]